MGERMTPAELDAADALANAATEGPWYMVPRGSGPGAVIESVNCVDVIGDAFRSEDAALAAAARSLVPRLVAEVRARDTVIEAVRAVHHEGVAYADDIDEASDVPDDYERHFCHEDGEDWPCATIRALEGATDE